MPNKGTIRGTHHLTFCVGGAQEDYDFHVRLLGLKSVKKTVLFDGEIPIYHLYYGNAVGDASTLLTSFPYRQAGWMGKRGTNQLKTLMLSVPADATAPDTVVVQVRLTDQVGNVAGYGSAETSPRTVTVDAGP